MRHRDVSNHVGGEKYDLFLTLNKLFGPQPDCKHNIVTTLKKKNVCERIELDLVVQKYSACASCLRTQTYIKRGLVISVTAFTVVHFVAMPLFLSLKPSVQ